MAGLKVDRSGKISASRGPAYFTGVEDVFLSLSEKHRGEGGTDQGGRGGKRGKRVNIRRADGFGRGR